MESHLDWSRWDFSSLRFASFSLHSLNSWLSVAELYATGRYLSSMTKSVFLVALVYSATSLGAQQVSKDVSAAAVASITFKPGDVRMGLTPNTAIAAALRDIDPARIRRTDSILVSFGTRHTLSDTLSQTRGVGAARRWIHSELSRYAAECGGCLKVEFDPGMVTVTRHPQRPSVNVVNVLAWLPGRDTSRVVVLGGHFDSCICSINSMDSTSDAPGADDDGSGSSAVIELARVLSKRFPKGLETSVLLALYAGEEQGLLGSGHLAERLVRQGYTIVAGMTDDIAGNVVAEDGRTDSTSVRVYAPGWSTPRTRRDSALTNVRDPDMSPSRELGRYVWAMGATYLPKFEVRPTWRLDRIQRGGDHSPFWQQGAPALRFTERLENYKRQHLPTDLLKDVNFGYVANIARLNLATVASLAMAPAAPDSAGLRRENQTSGGQKWTLSWRPVAGATSYEILLRRTTSPAYERVINVGNVMTYLVDEQLDDAWAGVRAVGPGGARSLTTVVTPLPSVTR